MRRIALVAGLLVAGCPAETDTISNDTGETGDTEVTETCVVVDQANVAVLPPSGLTLSFRALGCDGDALRPLTAADLEVVNDEAEKPFGPEGGGEASPPVPSDDVTAWTTIVVDLSNGAREAAGADDVLAAALALGRTLLTDGDEGADHRVAFVGMGAPDSTAVFSDDTTSLLRPTGTTEGLEEAEDLFLDVADDVDDVAARLESAGKLGTRDLYQTYLGALRFTARATSDGTDQRTVVVVTQGPHLAGNSGALKVEADAAAKTFNGTVHVVGVGSFDDPAILDDMAVAPGDAEVHTASDVDEAVAAIATSTQALAGSHYQVGICTPVALGEGSVSLTVTVDGAMATQRFLYDTTDLTGDLSSCDAWDLVGLERPDTGDTGDTGEPLGGYDLGTMVTVAGGTFTMGCSVGRDVTDAEDCPADTTPAHEVTITRDLSVMKSELTKAMWAQAFSTDPSYVDACVGTSCPVQAMSWQEAVAFANAASQAANLDTCYELTGCTGSVGTDFTCTGVAVAAGIDPVQACEGFRLPTEAEYEYLARGGASDGPFAGTDDVDAVGWTLANSGDTTHPVCTKAVNGFGLCDMVGNLREHVWEGQRAYSAAAKTDPAGPTGTDMKVFRGGGYRCAPDECRDDIRETASWTFGIRSAGFRLVRTLP